MSPAEIIAELPRLSAAELAQVQAKLRELVEPSHDPTRATRIQSPRLAQPEQMKDFIKQVVELVPDANL
jgi:cystathionine beta-lyase family protein involved in aluminum resistance